MPKNATQSTNIIQITDCHLFANHDALHLGQHVYNNLQRVLQKVANIPNVSAIIFSGDLSQDHSEQSYINFNDIFASVVKSYHLEAPLYWLPGNHDELLLLDDLLIHPQIKNDKTVELASWQLHLLNSKSSTPSGLVSAKELDNVSEKIRSAPQKHLNHLIFMHHPPIDVGYFIDKHGLQQKADFWLFANQHDGIKGIFCGHVHRGLMFPSSEYNKSAIYTCPATSIQFDPKSTGLSALDKGPGYRHITLLEDGTIESTLHYLKNLQGK